MQENADEGVFRHVHNRHGEREIIERLELTAQRAPAELLRAARATMTCTCSESTQVKRFFVLGNRIGIHANDMDLF